MFTPRYILIFTTLSLTALNGCTIPDETDESNTPSQAQLCGPTIAYEDLDGDGFGHTAIHIPDCTIPPGAVAKGGDCDDNTLAIHPNAPESCDGVDQDCDGQVDEDPPSTSLQYPDKDGDGFGWGSFQSRYFSTCPADVHYKFNNTDCNDTLATISPSAAELCDGIDNNCNDIIDDGAPDTLYYRDYDVDGFAADPTQTLQECGALGYVTILGDCDDRDKTVYPDAVEYCDDIDHDCDGATDNIQLEQAVIYYIDADGDGFGSPSGAASFVQCTPPIGYATNSEDCDDSNSNYNPASRETCDGADGDCDGRIDEDLAQITSYLDSDGDGFGDQSLPYEACSVPGGYAIALDCNDQDKLISPDAAELCDGIDNNCDGTADEWHSTTLWLDEDQDGYGTHYSPKTLCGPSAAYSQSNVDCNDQKSDRYPGAPDFLGDGIDQDCGGSDGQQPSVDLPGSLYSSLGDALEDAQSGDIVWIGPGSHPFDSMDLKVTSLSIRGTHGAEDTVLNRTTRKSAFDVHSGQSLDLKNLTLRGMESSIGQHYSAIQINDGAFSGRNLILEYNEGNEGGAIFSTNGTVSLVDSIVRDNMSFAKGGALFAEGGSTFLDNASFSNNLTTGDGGAIHASGAIDIRSSSFVDNEATNGGAITLTQFDATFSDVFFEKNLASFDGGAIHMSRGGAEIFESRLESNRGRNGGAIFTTAALSIENTALNANNASEGGGAVYALDSDLNIKNSLLSSNTSQSDGGAISVTNGNLKSQNNVISDNKCVSESCVGGGGGLRLKNATLNSHGDSITGNLTSKKGGGISLDQSSADLWGTRVAENASDSSGGGLALITSQVSIDNSSVSSNSAGGNGGAIDIDAHSSLLAEHTSISHNSAAFAGGGFFAYLSEIEATDLVVSSNSASTMGGGLYLDSSALTAAVLTLSENYAAQNGGGLYSKFSNTINISYLRAEGNRTPSSGGAFANQSELNIDHGVFLNNHARSGGGIVQSQYGETSLRHSVFANNEASHQGGAIYLIGGDFKMLGSIFSENEAPTGTNIYDTGSDLQEGGNLFWDFKGSTGWAGEQKTTLSPSSVVAYPDWQFQRPQDTLWTSDLHLSKASAGVDLANKEVCLAMGVHSQLCQDDDGTGSDAGIFGGPDGIFWDLDNDGLSDFPWPGQFGDAPTSVDANDFDANDRSSL